MPNTRLRRLRTRHRKISIAQKVIFIINFNKTVATEEMETSIPFHSKKNKCILEKGDFLYNREVTMEDLKYLLFLW